MKKKFFCYCILIILMGISGAAPGQANLLHVTENNDSEVMILRVPEDRATLTEAIDDIRHGGIIDIAAGTYTSPYGGFLLQDLGKGFTIRSREGKTVILDGMGSQNILHFGNSTQAQGGPVTFEGLTFANGYNASMGLAAGVSVVKADATFVNCTFRNNYVELNGVGGGVLVHESTAFFFDSTWHENASANYGGGLAVSENSKVYIHNSYFSNNRTNLPNHSPNASGGAVHVINSTLRVSNTRFENNQTGAFGGALYVLAPWAESSSNSRSDVIIANSTFINNRAAPDASVTLNVPTEGGAVNAEGQTVLKIYHSRFLGNSADIGGGVNNYRALVEIYSSIFQGNQANGVPSIGAFGGALSVSSLDVTEDGNTNHPAGQAIVEDTLFQGHYGDVTFTAPTGGCISGCGDSRRIDGDPSIPDMGSIAENRAIITLRRVVLNDCDVQSAAPDSAAGGGISIALTHLTMEDSIIMNSDSEGDMAFGGGLALVYDSLADISQTTWLANTSANYGGAIFSQGSLLNIADCNLIGNQAPDRYGAAILSAPDEARSLSTSGTVENCLISEHTGLPIFDDDRTNGPINDMQYFNNQFYHGSGGQDEVIYSNPISPYQWKTATELNEITINRANSTTTDKGSGNIALDSPPSAGHLLAVPPTILPVGAVNDSSPPAAYLAYAWGGTSAALDGNTLSNNSNIEPSTVGTHTLTINDKTLQTLITSPITPTATFIASGSPPDITLTWHLTTDSFLDAAIDQGVMTSAGASGSTQISTTTDTTYRLYVLTKEGGFVKTTSSTPPQLNAPDVVTILLGINLPHDKGYIHIRNNGGGILQWTATGQNPDLFTVDTISGETETTDTILLTIYIEESGTYTGYVQVEAGEAGSKSVQTNIIVVNTLYQVFAPFVAR